MPVRAALDPRAEEPEHPLGVVPRERGLGDADGHAGDEPGEEDGALHLRARAG
jgi:hypothetical protein